MFQSSKVALNIIISIRRTHIQTGSSVYTRQNRYCSTVPITKITEYLYYKGIDFGHCTDSNKLRELYHKILAREKSHDFTCRESQSTTMIKDPYPELERHAINPYHFVWEVKYELCRKSRVDQAQMDLVLNGKVLDDNKRICEYPHTSTFKLFLQSKS